MGRINFHSLYATFFRFLLNDFPLSALNVMDRNDRPAENCLSLGASIVAQTALPDSGSGDSDEVSKSVAFVCPISALASHA